MAYESQLVVRTRDEQGSKIIDQVKKLAKEKGRTYSEMAVELLARGLSVDEPAPGADSTAQPAPEPAQPAQPAQESAPKPDAPAAQEIPDDTVSLGAGSEIPNDGGSAQVADAQPAAEPAPEPTPEPTPEPEPAPEPVEPVELPGDGSVEAVVEDAVRRFEESGVQAAIPLLATFYTTCGPIEGGQLRDQLQSELDEAEYKALLRALRQTPQYQAYRQRVIFGN